MPESKVYTKKQQKVTTQTHFVIEGQNDQYRASVTFHGWDPQQL